MKKSEYRNKILDLILRYPPEIPMMRKETKYYDRIREKDFFRKMAFWVFPSIDATYFALQTLALLYDSEKNETISTFLNKYETNLRNFVFDRYDKVTGGFFQTEKNSYPTLHATHCVIGLINSYFVLKNKESLDFSKPTTRKKIEEFFGESNIDVYKSISRFVTSCYDSATGGFFEMPKNILQDNQLERVPSVNNTASALWCAFHFEDEITDYFSSEYGDVKMKIYNFIERKGVRKDDLTAYLNSQEDENPWICSTYYADRVLKNFDKPLENEDIIGILRFIVSIKKNDSGFCAGNDLDANIIHTKDAMSLLKHYFKVFETISSMGDKSFDYQRFVKIMCKDVIDYLEKTYVMGGFATAEKERYLPNVYATRLAYDIIKYIDYFCGEIGLDKPKYDFLDKKDTINYLFSCYDKESGAFRGFSKNKKYIIKEYVKGFFGLAA